MSLLIEKQKKERTEKSENGQNKNGQHQNGYRSPQSEYAPHDGKRVTEDEYWSLYYEKGNVEGDASYEWNNGILEAKPMASRRQARLYNWFFEVLCHFLKVNPMALMMNLEIGFRMEIDDPEHPGEQKTTNRKPDIGIICDDNPIPWLDEERSYKGICDMVIESISDSDQGEIDRDTIKKKAEYQTAGVREYFILDPTGDNQYFYRLNDENRYVEIPPKDGIIRSEVLPGFQFRLSDFSRQPILEEMAGDKIYQSFILPAYQAALKKIEEERLRAEEADTRAKEGHRRAEEADARAEEADARAEEADARAEEADARAEEERRRAEEAIALLAELKMQLHPTGSDESDLE